MVYMFAAVKTRKSSLLITTLKEQGNGLDNRTRKYCEIMVVESARQMFFLWTDIKGLTMAKRI